MQSQREEVEGCEPSEYETEVAAHVQGEMRSWGDAPLMSLSDIDWIIDAALHKMAADIKSGIVVPVPYLGEFVDRGGRIAYEADPRLLVGSRLARGKQP